mmetsp:Transcript_68947/g.179133  ORF Transcript_68947/g.179133 Transcript_68947/m.179133 type:complete len:182 (-) Transcript_68947:272-817(-)
MRLLTVPIVAVFSSVTTNWYWLGQRHRVAEVESQRAARVVAADREQVSARLARFKAELEESRGRVAELEAALAKQESPDVELDSDAQVEADEALQRRVAELEAMLVESRARILEAAAAPPPPRECAPCSRPTWPPARRLYAAAPRRLQPGHRCLAQRRGSPALPMPPRAPQRDPETPRARP